MTPTPQQQLTGEMKKTMPNHPDDQGAIEKLHVEFISRFDRVNDELATFQDAAYAMGRARGLLDAERQMVELREQSKRLRMYGSRADGAVDAFKECLGCE